MLSFNTLLMETRSAVQEFIGSGRVANYIPALAQVDPQKFGLAFVDLEGNAYAVGDAYEAFSIQSISKIFTLTLALGKHGNDLWKRVGREPSGSPFNSIVQLEHERGIPRNPFINAGALVVTDSVIAAQSIDAATNEILSFIRTRCDDDSVAIDPEVAASEKETGFRNASLANFMKGFGNLENPVAHVLEVYFNQCAIAMNCVQLARGALFLAAGGQDPVRNKKVVSEARARRIGAIMLTCGHYDASGDFAFRIGLPGKSGVGGGIVAIIPNIGSVAVWSPGLNANGNSLVGTLALEHLAAAAGWSVFLRQDRKPK